MLCSISHYGLLPGISSISYDDLNSGFKKILQAKKEMTPQIITKGFSKYYLSFVSQIFELKYEELPNYKNLK